MEPRNQFTFYRSYYDAIQELGKRDRAAIILAVCAYAIYEEEPEGLSPAATTAFKLIKPTLDSGRKKAEYGKMKGSRLEAERKLKASKIEAEGKLNGCRSEAERKLKRSKNKKEIEIDKDKDVDIDKDIDVDVDAEGCDMAAATADNKLRLFYGELGQGVVMLSQAQVEDLLEKLDLDAFDFYVKKLSTFILKNDAKVKSHYDTILKWWREDSRVEE